MAGCVAVEGAGDGLRAGEHLAAMRAQELRRGAQESERAAEELRARYEAHRQAARAVLQDVHRADWWAKATAGDIGRMYREATAWARVDGEAARAAERIVTEIRGRYEVNTSLRVEQGGPGDFRDEAAGELGGAGSAGRSDAERAVRGAVDLDELESEIRLFDNEMVEVYGRHWAERDDLPAEAMERYRRHRNWVDENTRRNARDQLMSQGVDDGAILARFTVDKGAPRPAKDALLAPLRARSGRRPSRRSAPTRDMGGSVKRELPSFRSVRPVSLSRRLRSWVAGVEERSGR